MEHRGSSLLSKHDAYLLRAHFPRRFLQFLPAGAPFVILTAHCDGVVVVLCSCACSVFSASFLFCDAFVFYHCELAVNKSEWWNRLKKVMDKRARATKTKKSNFIHGWKTAPASVLGHHA
jgi:hypothetical protein